jgi:hypothetical protein
LGTYPCQGKSAFPELVALNQYFLYKFKKTTKQQKQLSVLIFHYKKCIMLVIDFNLTLMFIRICILPLTLEFEGYKTLGQKHISGALIDV